MANSYVEIPVTGVDSYAFPFPYLEQSHIQVYAGGVLQTQGVHYTFTDSNTIEFSVDNVPTDTNTIVFIKRVTDDSGRLVTYSNTGLDADDLNLGSNQNFYLAQEAVDAAELNVTRGLDGNTSVDGRLSNVTDPVNAQDAATKAYVASQLTQSATGGVYIQTTAPDGAIVGDLWVNPDTNVMSVYTASGWSTGTTVEGQTFLFTSANTSTFGGLFTIATFAYGLQNISDIDQVFLNGVLLKECTVSLDFTSGDWDRSLGIISLENNLGLDDELTVLTSSRLSTVLADAVVNLNANLDTVLALASSGSVNGITLKEQFTATAGQQVFNLTNSYIQGQNNISVYVNGVLQSAYGETSTTSVTLANPASLGDEVVFIINEHSVSTTVTESDNVTYTPAGTGAVATTVQEKLREIVSVKDFGAVGDGVTDDTAAIQAALDAAGEAFGAFVVTCGSDKYRTTAPLILRADTTFDLQTCTIRADFNGGSIIQFEVVPAPDRPPFRIIGNGATIKGYGVHEYNTSLNGILVESSSFSLVEGISISGVNRPIVIAPTNRDCINNVYRDIDTRTNLGMRINAGLIDGVNYAQTTDGSFNDVFFTVIGANNGQSASRAIELVTGEGGSIFGLNFNRCSFNPVHEDGGEYIYMYNDPAFTDNNINTINFYNCEGESRFSGTTPTIPMIYAERVFNCYFNVDGYFDECAGVKLVNCNKNIFENMRDRQIVDSDALFIDLDSNCYDNVFRSVSPIAKFLSTEEGNTTAPNAANYWKRISDQGVNNRFEGMISTSVARVIKTDYLRDITTGNLTNPLYAGNEATTTWVDNGDSYSVTTTSKNGFKFRLPDSAELNKEYVYRLKYKFTGDISSVPDTWRIGVSTEGTRRNIPIPLTTTETEVMFRSKATGYSNRVESIDPVTSATIEILELEIFEGAFPYTPNYIPTDVILDVHYLSSLLS